MVATRSKRAKSNPRARSPSPAKPVAKPKSPSPSKSPPKKSPTPRKPPPKKAKAERVDAGTIVAGCYTGLAAVLDGAAFSSTVLLPIGLQSYFDVGIQHALVGYVLMQVPRNSARHSRAIPRDSR